MFVDTEWTFDSEPPNRELRRALPEELEGMSPGAGLSAVLASVDRSDLNGHELVVLLAARARQVAHLQAEMYADMWELAHSPAGDAQSPAERLDTVDEFASDEIAAALTLSPRTADGQLSLAYHLAELPRVWKSLQMGIIDLPRARVFCRETDHLEPEEARAIAESLLDTAADLTPGQLASRVRRRCLEQHPDAARRRHEEGVKERRVQSFPNPDGTGDLCARQLPPERITAILTRINTLARQHKGHDGRSMDQIRADILMDLLEGNTTYATNRGGGVEIQVNLTTLLDLDDRAAEIPGWGPIISDLARRVVNEQLHGPWRFVVNDPNTGQPIWTGTTRRRPTAGQRRHVEARNPTCSFPGCPTPATRCHMDHTIACHDYGKTVVINLGPLCARHHLRTKHRAGWHLEQPEPGTFVWTSPRGHRYQTRPPPV